MVSVLFSSFRLRRVSASSRADLCSLTRSLMLVAIREPVARLREGSRTGSSQVNTACRCFNRTALVRGAMGSSVRIWESASVAERNKLTRSHSKTDIQCASRLSATSASRILCQDSTGLGFPARSVQTNGGST